MAGWQEYEAERFRREAELHQVRQSVDRSVYSEEFLQKLERVPAEWHINGSQEGVRFLKNYPYDFVLYGMRGWDALQLVVTLDKAEQTVALRLHAYDEQADMTIEEGAIVRNGTVVSFDDTASVGFSVYQREYEKVLREIQTEKEQTGGTSGCSFDHLGHAIAGLPGVSEVLGSASGNILGQFMKAVGDGTLDPENTPPISLGWPLTTPYNAAQ